MELVFDRRLAIPVWAIAFFAVALAAPQPVTLFLMPLTTLFVMVTVGMAVIAFSIPGAIPWFRTSRALVRVRPSGRRDRASAAIVVAAGTCVRPLDEPNRSERDDALDLVRMDDDGGWQMPRPPA
jgi:hypothetical protein